MHALRRPKVRDQATDQIKQCITERQLAPGDRLPTEHPAIEAKLRELVRQFEAALDLKTFIGIDIEFHRFLLEASGLQPLVAFDDLLHIFFQTFRESVRKADWKSGVENHRRLVNDLAAGDVAKATALLRKHIESHRERI